MARPRKAEDQKARRREIYATDARWNEIADEAREAGLSVSQYLMRSETGGGRHLNPDKAVRQLEEVLRVKARLDRIAIALSGMDDARSIGCLARLVAIDRSLARLFAGVR